MVRYLAAFLVILILFAMMGVGAVENGEFGPEFDAPFWMWEDDKDALMFAAILCEADFYGLDVLEDGSVHIPYITLIMIWEHAQSLIGRYSLVIPAGWPPQCGITWPARTSEGGG